MADVNLRILLSAVGGGAVTSVIGDIARSLGKGGLGGALVGIGVAAGAAAIGIGVASVDAASKFQEAMLSLVAHAGLAQSQFNNVSQGVMQMATVVGRSPTELAQALYPILSSFSGISNQSAKTALSLATLKLSMETVAGTTVDGTQVAQAAVGTFNALGLSTNNAATNTARMTSLMDIMDKTVQLGNMQWDQYKNVISKLAVSIQGTGISFNEASAALSEMTNEGFSAQRAQTYLSNTFTTIAIKTDALATHAKKLGISFDESKYGPMTLAEKIQYLNQITDGNKQKLLALMGNNSTALKTFNALSTGLSGYNSNLQALNHSQGALASSFSTASQGFGFAMSKAKAAVDVVLIKIGTALLPILTKLVNAVVPIITKFGDWLVKSGVLQGALNLLVGIFSGLASAVSNVVGFFSQNQWAMDALVAVLVTAAGIIGGVLIPVLVGWAIAQWAVVAPLLMTALPFILIGLAIAAVIFIVILLIQHWKQVEQFALMIWGHIVQFFKDDVVAPIGNLFNQLGTKIHGIIQGIGNFFSGLGTTAHNVVTSVGNGFSALGTKAHGIWDGARNKAGSFFSWLGTQGHNVTTGVGGAFSWLGTQVHDKINDIGKFFSWLGTQGHNLLQTMQNITGGIGQAFQNAGKWIGDKINTAMQAVKNAINWVIRGINNFINFLDGIHIQIPAINIGPVHIGGGSIGLPHIPDIPLLAQGGVITSGGSAIVGDAGPELLNLPTGASVMPLGSGGTFSSGMGGGITNNFYISLATFANSQSEMARVVDLLEQELARRFRMATPSYAASNIF